MKVKVDRSTSSFSPILILTYPSMALKRAPDGIKPISLLSHFVSLRCEADCAKPQRISSSRYL
uniref:Uncharacterized protein n=1 Tax=Ascaris lumbricoides TaxID=6252 RepID=A0A0M3HEZ5_ASCLU